MLFLLILFSAALSAPHLTEEERRNRHRRKNSLFGYRALTYIQYLMTKDVVGKDFARVGSSGDGGYWILDDFPDISSAYSIHIGSQWPFEADLVSRGLDVFIFNHTIPKPVINNPRLKFYEIGIVPEKKLHNFESLLNAESELNRKNKILKMDVEGDVWNMLDKMPTSTLEKFSQIIMKLQDFQLILVSDERYKIGLSVFERLNRTHQLVHIHGSNCGLGDNLSFGRVPFPIVFEVCFVRRCDNIQFAEPKRRKRTDNRCDRTKGELLIWWTEGTQQGNIKDLLDYYKEISAKSSF